MRERLVKARTALINEIRGLLSEYGIILPKGVVKFRQALLSTLGQEQAKLTELATGADTVTLGNVWTTGSVDLGAGALGQLQTDLRGLEGDLVAARKAQNKPGVLLLGTIGFVIALSCPVVRTIVTRPSLSRLK